MLRILFFGSSKFVAEIYIAVVSLGCLLGYCGKNSLFLSASLPVEILTAVVENLSEHGDFVFIVIKICYLVIEMKHNIT